MATFQWMRDGSPIVGATSQNYAVTAEDEGAAITCVVDGATSNAITGTWVSTFQDGTRALLDMDLTNGRYWFDGAEYDLAGFRALAWVPDAFDPANPQGALFTTGTLPFPGYDQLRGAFIVDATPIDNGQASPETVHG